MSLGGLMPLRSRSMVSTALVVLIGTAVPARATGQSAATRARIEAVYRGSLLPAARRLQTNLRPPLPRARRSDAAARVERLLGRAIEESGHRPERARQLVGAAARLAGRHRTGLDRGQVQKVRDAAARFQRLGEALVRTDPTVRRLIPREGDWPLRTVGAYAELYAEWQRKYNGPRPSATLTKNWRYRGRLRGRVPYWDVDPSIGDVDVVGLTEGSPFVTQDGRVRIFSHYLSPLEHRRLRAELGAPTGTMEAAMTSSYRTLIMYPEGRLPFMLKFSGHEMVDESKRLEDSDVRASVERSLQLRRHRFIVPEPSGLLARGVNVLYRPLPLPSRGALHRGDRLITWQVLMSRDFRVSRAGRRFFERYDSFQQWCDREAIPKLAQLLYDSMFESFGHLELHTQNVDVLASEDGELREVFVKDLLDMMHDPLAEAASGREPLAPLVTRDQTWGDMGQAGSGYDVPRFYRTYLGQLHDGTGRRFHRRLVNQLLALVRERPPAPHLERFPELREAAHDSFDPFRALASIRRAVIKARVEQSFRPDPAARARFESAGPRDIVGIDRAAASGFELTPQMELGFVGNTPAAVIRRNGLVERCFLRFR